MRMHIIPWFVKDEWTMNQKVENEERINCVLPIILVSFRWQKMYDDRYAIRKNFDICYLFHVTGDKNQLICWSIVRTISKQPIAPNNLDGSSFIRSLFVGFGKWKLQRERELTKTQIEKRGQRVDRIDDVHVYKRTNHVFVHYE